MDSFTFNCICVGTSLSSLCWSHLGADCIAESDRLCHRRFPCAKGTPSSPFVNYLDQYRSYSALLADVLPLFIFLYLNIAQLVLADLNRGRALALLTLLPLPGSFSLLIFPILHMTGPLQHTEQSYQDVNQVISTEQSLLYSRPADSLSD